MFGFNFSVINLMQYIYMKWIYITYMITGKY